MKLFLLVVNPTNVLTNTNRYRDCRLRPTRYRTHLQRHWDTWKHNIWCRVFRSLPSPLDSHIQYTVWVDGCWRKQKQSESDYDSQLCIHSFDSWRRGSSMLDVLPTLQSLHGHRRHAALRLRLHLQSKLSGQVLQPPPRMRCFCVGLFVFFGWLVGLSVSKVTLKVADEFSWIFWRGVIFETRNSWLGFGVWSRCRYRTCYHFQSLREMKVSCSAIHSSLDFTKRNVGLIT